MRCRSTADVGGSTSTDACAFSLATAYRHPYGFRASTVTTRASRVDRRRAQEGAPSLREQVEDVTAQLTAAALPL